MSHTVYNLHNKRIIFLIYVNKITLILHPGSQYHVNIIGTHPHNFQIHQYSPIIDWYGFTSPQFRGCPPLGCFWHLFLVCPYVKCCALSWSLTEASAYNKQFAGSQGGPLIRASVSLTDLTESVKSPKKMAMNVQEKDTILSFNVPNQSNIIYSISDSISHSFIWKIYLILINYYILMYHSRFLSSFMFWQ